VNAIVHSQLVAQWATAALAHSYQQYYRDGLTEVTTDHS